MCHCNRRLLYTRKNDVVKDSARDWFALKKFPRISHNSAIMPANPLVSTHQLPAALVLVHAVLALVAHRRPAAVVRAAVPVPAKQVAPTLAVHVAVALELEAVPI